VLQFAGEYVIQQIIFCAKSQNFLNLSYQIVYSSL